MDPQDAQSEGHSVQRASHHRQQCQLSRLGCHCHRCIYPTPTSASLAGAPNAGWSEVVVVVSAIVRVRVYRMLSAMLLSLTVFCRCGRESTHPASPGPALTAENAQDEPRAGLPLTLWLSDVKRQ